MIYRYRNSFLFFLAFAFVIASYGQSKKQQELEDQRQALQREIQQINKVLSKEKKEETSVLSLVEDLNYKINVQRNLIKVTNQQANLLTREINTNQKNITSLREQLVKLKEGYASMVVKSYKGKNEQSRVMFLLSSTNFQQAYKRLQYIKQYANFQKQQAEEIKLKTEKLQVLNTQLLVQKQDKQNLIDENRIAKRDLEKERTNQKELIATIKKNMSRYESQVNNKQKEINRIDREINTIIKEAIAVSNKKAGKSTSSNTFALTPESKKLAVNFESNKGNLPWPVTQGAVTLSFGEHRHPVVKTTTIINNGLRIATNKGAKSKAVFNGLVSEILKIKGTKPIVMVRHGNYISIYKNLSKIYVQKGDTLKTGDEIGEVATDSDGKTVLAFSIFKDAKPINPSYWLLKR